MFASAISGHISIALVAGIELETRVAYQEKLLCDLDEVVQAFAKRVEKVEQKLRSLKAEQLEHRDEMEPHNTPPPHY